MERDEFATIREAATELGLTEVAVRKRIARRSLPAYVDPLDQRKRLIRRDDLAAFREPRLIEPRPRRAPEQEATVA